MVLGQYAHQGHFTQSRHYVQNSQLKNGKAFILKVYSNFASTQTLFDVVRNQSQKSIQYPLNADNHGEIFDNSSSILENNFCDDLLLADPIEYDWILAKIFSILSCNYNLHRIKS